MAFRRKWVIIGCVAAALVGGVYWGIHSIRLAAERDRILRDPFSDHPLKYEELGPSYYFRFTYRATFDGEPIELDRFIECRPFLTSTGIGGGINRDYQQITEVAGVRLKTGSVVYFQVPRYCRFSPSDARWKKYWHPGESVDAIPLTLWADSAENPEIIEAYTAPEYFTDVGARLRIIESRVTYMPRDFAPDKKPGSDLNLKKRRWRGWSLISLPVKANEMALGEPLSESATGRLRAFRIPEAMDRQIHPVRTAASAYLAGLRWGRPMNLPDALFIPSENTDQIAEGRAIAARMIPLLWNGREYLVVEGAPPGLVFLPYGRDGYAFLGRQDQTVTFGDDRITLPTSKTNYQQIAVCDRSVGTCFGILMHWWNP